MARAAQTTITVDGRPVVIKRKAVKYVRLHVDPKDGHLWVSMPARLGLAHVVAFVRERRSWIEEAQRKVAARQAALAAAAAVPPKVPLSTPIWGQETPLDVREWTGSGAPPAVPAETEAGLVVYVAPGQAGDAAAVWDAIGRFYHSQVELALPTLARKWEPVVGQQAARWTVRAMKTRWGSCRKDTGRITLSRQLAALPPQMLEQVVVHELVHLWVANHGPEFYRRMDQALPGWREIRRAMRRYPAGGGLGPVA
ncbi:MAG: M48 family metallopeptidase [Bifidobacteriaceae bacterium]|jgi:predicted metal-dependent hydrolase|nr:M48 family metallopeptidase [Bifidobacteriaceae bacterium]